MSPIISPLGNHIVAVQEPVESTTSGGIALPENTQQKSNIAKIIAVGPKSSLQVNDRIIYKEPSSTAITIAGVHYLVIHEDDVVATLN